MSASVALPGGARRPAPANLRIVVAASAVGTAFEWYEFFLFGAVASIIAAQFFASVGETAGFIFTLLTFAAGFVMRPLGALAFGRMGDRYGRKRAFFVTILLMGVATVGIGLLPTHAQIGLLAPALLIALRMAQGFALGGEYGGAATYVAEYAPPRRRGFHTSLIHAAGGAGLFLALFVVYATRTALGEDEFRAWGWRIPFLVSAVVLALALWARMRLDESPSFRALQATGRVAKAPVREAFLEWRNLRLVLVALFGFMAADGAIWYASHFYTQFFLERSLRVEPGTVNLLFMYVAAIGAPAYVCFGALSDRVGRKPVVVLGIAAALIAYVPLYHWLARAANPALMRAVAAAPVVANVPAGGCAVQFDPVGAARFGAPCDVAKRVLARTGVAYEVVESSGAAASVVVGSRSLAAPDLRGLAAPEARRVEADYARDVRAALDAAGYPSRAAADEIRWGELLFVLALLVLPAAAVFGPLGASLVELFPTRVRYTAMSLPFHVGAGWFGGFMPAIAFAIVAETGDIFSGLTYVLVVAAASLCVAIPFWKETRGRDLDA